MGNTGLRILATVFFNMLYGSKTGKGLAPAVEVIFYEPFRRVGIELFRV
jgi:hypothetical protein